MVFAMMAGCWVLTVVILEARKLKINLICFFFVLDSHDDHNHHHPHYYSCHHRLRQFSHYCYYPHNENDENEKSNSRSLDDTFL